MIATLSSTNLCHRGSHIEHDDDCLLGGQCRHGASKGRGRRSDPEWLMKLLTLRSLFISFAAGSAWRCARMLQARRQVRASKPHVRHRSTASSATGARVRYRYVIGEITVSPATAKLVCVSSFFANAGAAALRWMCTMLVCTRWTCQTCGSASRSSSRSSWSRRGVLLRR